MAVSVSPRTQIGARLKEARARRKATLEEASLSTRIKPKFLEALEVDSPPSAFPAPVYARAFLREYAAFLRLDPEPLVEDYRRAHGDTPSVMTLPRPVQGRSRRRIVQRGLLVLGLAALAALAVITARQEVLRLPAPPQAEPAAEPADVIVPPAAPPTGVALEIRVKDAESWVRVGSGGETLVKGTRRPGWSRAFSHPERLRIVLGNAGAVRLFLNGERLGKPGEYGEVYKAMFVRRDGDVEIELR